MLSVCDLINVFHLTIPFYSFSDDAHNINVLFNSIDVELGICSVTAVDADGLKPKELLKDVSVDTVIDYSIKFDIVALASENAMLYD